MKRKIVLLLLLTLLVAAVIFCFVINRWGVTITLAGDSSVTLECGTAYEDPGATAIFGASLFAPELRIVPVTAQEALDPDHVGEYRITYTAGYLFWKAEAVRTVRYVDTTPPELLLMGGTEVYDLPERPYEEQGFTATDSVDGDLTAAVVAERLDSRLVYSVTDSSGNRAEAVRIVHDRDDIPPVLTLKGEPTLELKAGESYLEPGFTAVDALDGDLTASVTVTGEVNPYCAGSYELTYTVCDSYGNYASAQRSVTVVPTPQPERVDPGDKIIYLTFDDGPGGYTRELLEVLERYNVKVTFFVVDSGNPDIIASAYQQGHSIGIHSATHKYSQIYESEAAYFADLEKMSDIIYDATGHRTTLVRFPGGSSNTVSSFNPGIMTRLAQALTDCGYQYFDWNVDSNDAGGASESEEVFDNVVEGVSNRNVSIVLQHDIKGFSVRAVEKIIIWGLENGYTFLPLTPESPTAHHGIAN